MWYELYGGHGTAGMRRRAWDGGHEAAGVGWLRQVWHSGQVLYTEHMRRGAPDEAKGSDEVDIAVRRPLAGDGQTPSMTSDGRA